MLLYLTIIPDEHYPFIEHFINLLTKKLNQSGSALKIINSCVNIN